MEPDANGGILSVGLAANYMGKPLGNGWIYIDDGDAVIPQNSKSGTTIDADLGVMYRVPGSFYAGLSTTRLAATDLQDLNVSSVRHLYLQAGYEQALGDGTLRLRSHVLAKTDLNATTVDLHANVLWNELLYGGLSIRPGDAVAPVIGFESGKTKSENLSRSEPIFRFGYRWRTTAPVPTKSSSRTCSTSNGFPCSPVTQTPDSSEDWATNDETCTLTFA